MVVFPRPLQALVLAGIVAITACGGGSGKATSAQAAMAADSAKVQMEQAAKSLVTGALVKTGDKVVVRGSPRDYQMLEEIAVDVMKAGGQPIVVITTDRITRRSYTEVPESYDSQPLTMQTALANVADVVISIDPGDTETVLAELAPTRIAARNAQMEAVTQAMASRHVRYVNLGNGAYPTSEFSQRVRTSREDLARMFVKASSIPADTLRARAEGLRAAMAAGKRVTLTSANGTNLTFSVIPAMVAVSDGTLKPDRVHLGGMNSMTRFPAGELVAPIAKGTATGKLVIDKTMLQGVDVADLTMTFENGHMKDFTATFGLKEAKAAYAASHGAKDELGWIDIGLNPAITLPTNSGRSIFMASGGVTMGLGDNIALGGTNSSDLISLFGAVSAPTITVDGKVYVDKGVLK